MKKQNNNKPILEALSQLQNNIRDKTADLLAVLEPLEEYEMHALIDTQEGIIKEIDLIKYIITSNKILIQNKKSFN